jgi:hypothetical protein
MPGARPRERHGQDRGTLVPDHNVTAAIESLWRPGAPRGRRCFACPHGARASARFPVLLARYHLWRPSPVGGVVRLCDVATCARDNLPAVGLCHPRGAARSIAGHPAFLRWIRCCGHDWFLSLGWALEIFSRRARPRPGTLVSFRPRPGPDRIGLTHKDIHEARIIRDARYVEQCLTVLSHERRPSLRRRGTFTQRAATNRRSAFLTAIRIFAWQ